MFFSLDWIKSFVQFRKSNMRSRININNFKFPKAPNWGILFLFQSWTVRRIILYTIILKCNHILRTLLTLEIKYLGLTYDYSIYRTEILWVSRFQKGAIHIVSGQCKEEEQYVSSLFIILSTYIWPTIYCIVKIYVHMNRSILLY